jgi:preprotein translocase subunit SecA
MPYDLGDMIKYFGPGVGGQWAGENEALSQKKQGLSNDHLAQQTLDLQQAYGQNEKMNPLLVDQRRLANQGLEAGLPGIAADSTLKGINATKAGATLQTDIAAGNDDNIHKMDENKMKKIKQVQDVFTASAPIIRQTPNWKRAEVLSKYLENAGVNPQSAQYQQFMQMADKDPDNLPTVMDKMADEMGAQLESASPVARSAKAVANINATSHEKVAAGNNAATIQAARISADSREAVASAKNKVSSIEDAVRSGKVTPDKAAVAYDLEAQTAPTQELKDYYKGQAYKMQQLAVALKDAGAPGKADLGALGVTPRQSVAPLKPPGAPKGTGTKDDPIILN